MFTKEDLLRLTDIQSFHRLSDKDFEYCCKYLLDASGYGHSFVTKKGPKGGDGGIDLDIYGSDHTVVACGQCKRWSGRYHGLMAPIRELAGSMLLKGVSRGVFLITTESTPEERAVAAKLNIKMIDAPALLRLVEKLHEPKAVVATSIVMNEKVPIVQQTQEPPSKSFGPVLATIAKFILAALLIFVIATAKALWIMVNEIFNVLASAIEEAMKVENHSYHYRKYRPKKKRYYSHGYRHRYQRGWGI